MKRMSMAFYKEIADPTVTNWLLLPARSVKPVGAELIGD